jgi:lysozyme
VTVPLFQYEFAAFVSLAYNIGVGAFCGSTLVKKLNAEDYAGACAEISKWNKFKGKPLLGLTRRRAEERAICEGRGNG